MPSSICVEHVKGLMLNLSKFDATKLDHGKIMVGFRAVWSNGLGNDPGNVALSAWNIQTMHGLGTPSTLILSHTEAFRMVETSWATSMSLLVAFSLNKMQGGPGDLSFQTPFPWGLFLYLWKMRHVVILHTPRLCPPNLGSIQAVGPWRPIWDCQISTGCHWYLHRIYRSKQEKHLNLESMVR